MSKYSKFYFLHIPKTGGRFLTKYIINPIEEILKANNIEVLALPPNVEKHGGWHKDIDENTYIVSVFREPVEFFVSTVAHIAADQKGLIKKESEYVIKNKSEVLNIEKEFLYKVLEEMEYFKDFQSRNFLLTPEERQLIQHARRAFRQNDYMDKEVAYERIQRVNLMIRNKDLISMDYSLLINKISKDLEIKIDIDLPIPDREYYKNNSSEVLFNKLNLEDKEKICNNFLFDKEIYENDSLFWTAK